MAASHVEGMEFATLTDLWVGDMESDATSAVALAMPKLVRLRLTYPPMGDGPVEFGILMRSFPRIQRWDVAVSFTGTIVLQQASSSSASLCAQSGVSHLT